MLLYFSSIFSCWILYDDYFIYSNFFLKKKKKRSQILANVYKILIYLLFFTWQRRILSPRGFLACYQTVSVLLFASTFLVSTRVVYLWNCN